MANCIAYAERVNMNSPSSEVAHSFQNVPIFRTHQFSRAAR
jgi:hypothetical protein